MIKEKIILVGGGGHCRSAIDVIETQERYEIVGIVDTKEHIGEKILSYPIIGSDDDIDNIIKDYPNFLITIGQIKSSAKREYLFSFIKKRGGKFPIIISPKSHISKYASIDEGTIIMHQALLNTMCKVGRNCIINSGSILEHDVIIEDHCHISTGTIINGGCKVRIHSFIGSNSTLIEGVDISSDNLIAAGSVIIKNIDLSGLYAGNPAKYKRKIK